MILIEYKYESFEEYIQLNYLEMIKKSLQEFLEKVECENFDNDSTIIRKISINSISVTTIKFTKSLIDNVEFKLYFKATYDVIDEEMELPINVKRKSNFLFAQ